MTKLPLPLNQHEVKLALYTKPGQTFMIARPLEPQPKQDEEPVVDMVSGGFYTIAGAITQSPFGKVGDELYGQEPFGTDPSEGDVLYVAGGEGRFIWLPQYDKFWSENKTPRYFNAEEMPEDFSRLPLINRGTVVERRSGVWTWIIELEVEK